MLCLLMFSEGVKCFLDEPLENLSSTKHMKINSISLFLNHFFSFYACIKCFQSLIGCHYCEGWPLLLNIIWSFCEALEHFILMKIFILQDCSKSIQISAFHIFKVITSLFSLPFKFFPIMGFFLKIHFHREKQIGVQKNAHNVLLISIFIFSMGIFLLRSIQFIF